MKTLEQKLKQLGREIGKLPETVDRKIARRNGRKRVLGLLRQIRAEVDEKWPAIVERAGQVRLTPEGRWMRAKRRGLDHIAANVAGQLAAVGVRIRRIDNRIYAPHWAVSIFLYKKEKLSAVVKDRKIRNALLAERALLT